MSAFIDTRKGVPPAQAVAGALSGLIDDAVADMAPQPKPSKKTEGVTITVPYEVLSESAKKK